MSEKLLSCPFCGGEACMNEHVFTGYSSTFGVVCLDCCAETRQFYDIKEEAIAAWNRRAQPSEKPLTLDELRQMDGRVWVCYQQETWGPQHPVINGLCCSAYKFSFDNYGKTWLAYRSKPKEEV